MPDKQTDAKAEEWFSKECWLELFGESITELPDMAEQIMLLMISLRETIGTGKKGRKAARRAIQNCVKACIPFTQTKVLAEGTELEAKRRMKERQPLGRQ